MTYSGSARFSLPESVRYLYKTTRKIAEWLPVRQEWSRIDNLSKRADWGELGREVGFATHSILVQNNRLGEFDGN